MSFVCFQLSLDLHYTEDEIYELSLAREPRGSLSSVSYFVAGMLGFIFVSIAVSQ
jgi:hypothetical protein